MAYWDLLSTCMARCLRNGSSPITIALVQVGPRVARSVRPRAARALLAAGTHSWRQAQSCTPHSFVYRLNARALGQLPRPIPEAEYLPCLEFHQS